MVTRTSSNAAGPDLVDITDPTVKLLKGLHLLGNGDGDADSAGASVLESDTTALTKWVAGVVAALGGVTAIAGGAAGFIGESLGVKIAVVAGLAAIVCALIFAVAWVIRTDLRCRARGQMAIYAARERIALALLNEGREASTADSQPPSEPLPDIHLDTHLQWANGRHGAAADR